MNILQSRMVWAALGAVLAIYAADQFHWMCEGISGSDFIRRLGP